MLSSSLLTLVALAGCSGLQLAAPGLPGASASKFIREVCPGSPYAAIQDAIDAASSGDEVVICDGVFQEQLVVDGKSLTLRSERGAGTTVVTAASQGPTLTILGGANAIIEGLTLAHGMTNDDGGNVACVDATITLAESVIDGGLAANGGGLAASSCTVELLGNVFTHNGATGMYGGAIYLEGSSGRVVANVVETNRAYYGGGLYVAGDDVLVEGNEILSNNAQNGGGMYMSGDATIAGNTIELNDAGWVGGGLYADDHDGVITDNLFANNVSFNDGGGGYLRGGSATLRGNVFLHNVAGDDAGGLRVQLFDGLIDQNDFSGNRAASLAGALKVSHEGATLSGNTFAHNSAGRCGGALALDESSSILTGNSFVHNRAAFGGAAYVFDGWGPVVIEDSSFTSNLATGSGGQLYVEDLGAPLTLRRVTFASGSAAVGGALHVRNSEIDVTNTLFFENAASVEGGAIYLEATWGTITNVVAWNNRATGGSALTVASGGALMVTNSVLGENRVSAAVTVGSGSVPGWGFADMYLNAGNFVGMAIPLGPETLVIADPQFSDAAAGVFTLQTTSPLIDSGDPDILDADGSRSDLGLYGGPDGSGW